MLRRTNERLDKRYCPAEKKAGKELRVICMLQEERRATCHFEAVIQRAVLLGKPAVAGGGTDSLGASGRWGHLGS